MGRAVRAWSSLPGVLVLVWAGALLGDESPLVIANGGIAAPLTTVPGDPARGEALVRDMSRASCLICHQMPIADEPDKGTIGPDLSGVASRLTEAQLRLRLVDARKANPDTVMPPYHATDGLVRVGAAFAGQPIYSAQEVEDVLAWLKTLRGP